MNKTTASDVAAWMHRRLLNDRGYLAQDDAAAVIESKFGVPFVKITDSGGLSIASDVLAEFRRLTENTVVWDRSERAWRLREPTDAPGRLAE